MSKQKQQELARSSVVAQQIATTRLASFANITASKVEQSAPAGKGQFVYVDISSVDNKLKRITEPKTLDISVAPSRAKQKLQTGDVLVSMTRPNLNAVAVVPLELDGAVGSTGFHVLRANAGTEPGWLYYAVQTHRFISAMSKLVQGALYPAVRPKDIRAFEIPHPPSDQQKRIVEEIEKQFSRLDEAIANLKRVKANLKRHKATVLKAAVEGRLVETEASIARREGRSYETGEQLLQRILETRRSQWKGKGKYKEPVAPDTTDLPELPEGWVWATVDQLAAPVSNSITDGPFGSNLKTEHYQETGPRVIRLQNIKDGEFADEYAHISTAHFERLRKHEIQAGDLAIATLGDNPPRACIIPSFIGPAIVKADCIRFKPHSALTPVYLNAALNCQPTRQRVKKVLHGIGRPRLSLGEIRAIALPLPPESEQHRIVTEIERRLSIGDQLEMQIDINLQRSDRTRQSILANAFSGRLALRDVVFSHQADLLMLTTADKPGTYEQSVKMKPSK